MLLITPTLLNSWRYYLNQDVEDNNTEQKARQDFLRLLSREKIEANEAMLRGIEFEEKVKAYCENSAEGIENSVKEIGDVCKGGLWQVILKKELGDFLLYGRADVIKANTIYDIKYTFNYDINKYYASMQHRLYLYCSGLPNFSYLVSDGKNVWREDYFNNAQLKIELEDTINEFINYLKNDIEAQKLFYEKWKALN